MAEPLKNSFGTDVIDRIGAALVAVDPDFPVQRFADLAADGFLDLELTPRGRKISTALAETLPADRARALGILQRSLGPQLGEIESDGMATFVYLPHVFFVAEHGLDHFEEAMEFQYEVTRRFTAEFSIRAFLDHHTERTLQRLARWTADPDMHVRRLVSEGTRPRLPWAPRLQRFITDPMPVVALLERLKDDPSAYVRRSVANNLNDVSKDHPDLVVEVASRWSEEADRMPLIRHALRSLVKAGHSGALSLLGYGGLAEIEVVRLAVDPTPAVLGERFTVEAEVVNRSSRDAPLLVDLRVHFVKADGRSSPKVFKGREMRLGPGEGGLVRKAVSLARHTTRTPYPGDHKVEVVVNGEVLASERFQVVEPSRGRRR